MNRLEHLLAVEEYDGLTDIVLESPCFQLDENGEVYRHVFLGMTKHELLLATQRIPNFENLTEAVFKPNIDLELDGLQLKCGIPLKWIKFYVVDDRSRKFAVCSCFGQVEYFELCNTPDGSDTAWTNWREYFSQQDNPRSYGYKTWEFQDSNLISICHLEFIRRPFPFYCVESVGVQTSAYKPEVLSEECRDEKLIKKYFKIPMDKPFKRKSFLKSTSLLNLTEIPEAKQNIKSSSKSCSDVNDENHMLCPTVQQFLIFSILYQSFDGDREKTTASYLETYPAWKSVGKIFRLYSKILKQQTQMSNSSIDESDSNVSISDIVEDYKPEQKPERKSAKSKWLVLSKKVKQTVEMTAFEKVVLEAVFEKCGPKKRITEIDHFTASEVTTELLLMSSELVVKISYSDFTSLYNKQIAHSVDALLTHFKELSLMISNDISSKTTPQGKYRTILFYIKVAELCLAFHDYQTCQAVLFGLHSPQVYLLNNDWSYLNQKSPQEYQKLSAMSKLILEEKCYIQHHIEQRKDKTRLPILHHLILHLWTIRPKANRFQRSANAKTMKLKRSGTKLQQLKQSLSSSVLKIKTSAAKVVSNIHIDKVNSSASTGLQIPDRRGPIAPVSPESKEETSSEQTIKGQLEVANDFSNTILQEAITIVTSKDGESKLNLKPAKSYDGDKIREDEIKHHEKQTDKANEGDVLLVTNQKNKKDKKRKFFSRKKSKTEDEQQKVSKLQEKQAKGEGDKAKNKTENEQKGSKLKVKQKKQELKRKESIDKHTQTDDEETTAMKGSKETIENIPTASTKKSKLKEKLQENEKPRRENKNSPDEESITISGGIARPGSGEELPMAEELNVQKTSTISIPSINVQRTLQVEESIEDEVSHEKRQSLKPTIEIVESIEDENDSQYYTTRHKSISIGDGSRRKSLFEESADDEKMLEQREAQMENAIEEKVKEVRRGSIFDDSYLDTDPAVPEVPVSKPKDTRRPSLLQSLFNRAEKQEPKVSYDKRQSLVRISEASVCSCTSETNSKEIRKKGRNVSFGGVDLKSFTLLGKSNDENTNSSGFNKTAHTCEHCGGPCIYYTDPFHEILNCQVLAITFMNSNSSRVPLRRLIQDKINQTIKH